jgi:hypothetical protein
LRDVTEEGTVKGEEDRLRRRGGRKEGKKEKSEASKLTVTPWCKSS